MTYASDERVVSPWRWMAYDDHGPWDTHLSDPLPTHGWRRIVEQRLGPVELLVTEWHFGPQQPTESPNAHGVREIHAVRTDTTRAA